MIPVSPVLPKKSVPEVIYAKDQKEYLPLPAVNIQYPDGSLSVLSRWKLSWKERFRIFFSGSLWLEQLTFGQPLQPQRPTVVEPRI